MELKRDKRWKDRFCFLTQQIGQRSIFFPWVSSAALLGMTQCHSLWCRQRCCFAYRWCRPWSEMWFVMGNRAPPAPSHLWGRNKRHIGVHKISSRPLTEWNHYDTQKHVKRILSHSDVVNCQWYTSACLTETSGCAMPFSRVKYVSVYKTLQQCSVFHRTYTLVTHLSKLMSERTTSLGAGPLQCSV